MLPIGRLGTIFSDIQCRIKQFQTQIHLKMASAKCRPYCSYYNVLIELGNPGDEGGGWGLETLQHCGKLYIGVRYLCGISAVPFEILHKISYPYIERCVFYTHMKIPVFETSPRCQFSIIHSAILLISIMLLPHEETPVHHCTVFK